MKQLLDWLANRRYNRIVRLMQRGGLREHQQARRWPWWLPLR